MPELSLGLTGIHTEKNAFGALPIQRVDLDTAVKLLRKAYDGGITFYDTARGYSDSEEKISRAFAGMRDKIFIATKTPARSPEKFWQDLDTSLSTLKTDYLDLYQFHNPASCYQPADGTGMYECMLEAKKAGKIRHIGFTNHRLKIARECVRSGLYATLQFPFSYLSTDIDIELVHMSQQAGMGFIAMKALSGGLITNSAAAYAFMSQYDNVLPIWGIQKESELDEYLEYVKNPPTLTSDILADIEKDKQELTGAFCRGCGYCMPCPEGINIGICSRMTLLVKRAPKQNWFSQNAREMMLQTENCTECGRCISLCPYSLNPPQLLKKNYKEYKEFLGI